MLVVISYMVISGVIAIGAHRSFFEIVKSNPCLRKCISLSISKFCIFGSSLLTLAGQMNGPAASCRVSGLAYSNNFSCLREVLG